MFFGRAEGNNNRKGTFGCNLYALLVKVHLVSVSGFSGLSDVIPSRGPYTQGGSRFCQKLKLFGGSSSGKRIHSYDQRLTTGPLKGQASEGS